MINRCAVDGVACIGIRRIGIELSQCAGQCVRVASQVRAGFVGLIFAGARDGQLDQHSGQRSDDHHDQRAEASAAACSSRPPPPKNIAKRAA